MSGGGFVLAISLFFVTLPVVLLVLMVLDGRREDADLRDSVATKVSG